MENLFDDLIQQPNEKLMFFIELGLNHEQQHQELLLMDIKHNFSVNPLKPTYRQDLAANDLQISHPIAWQFHKADIY